MAASPIPVLIIVMATLDPDPHKKFIGRRAKDKVVEAKDKVTEGIDQLRS